MKSFDVEIRDNEGDNYESSFDTLQEALQYIRLCLQDDCEIVQTWRYDEEDEYIGPIKGY
jgi:hypothetical protein